MNNQEYTKILTDLFMECSTKLYERESGRGYSHAVANMFREASGAYNDTLAAKFIHQLRTNYPTIHEKLENYPEIFWQTAQSKNEINDGFKNLIDKETKFNFDILGKGYRSLPNANKDTLELAVEKLYGAVTTTLDKVEDAAKKIEYNGEEWIPLYLKHFQDVIGKVSQIQLQFKQPFNINFINDYIDSKGYKKDLSDYFKEVAQETVNKVYNSIPNNLPRHKM